MNKLDRIYKLISENHAIAFILPGDKEERLKTIAFALKVLDDKLDLDEGNVKRT